MPDTLNDVKIVDLRRSELDKRNSDIDKNIYKFKKKVYVQHPEDYLKTETRHPYFFHWGRMTADGRAIETWRNRWNYDFLTKEDSYWPEGVRRNEEGHYQWGDAVLMKIPIRDFIKKRKQELRKANQAPVVAMRKFKESLPKEARDDELLKDIHEFV